ncbi:MAG: hypothetical protein PVI78_11425 [Anaerolineales bacterium]|jgi:hypothetical protein
MTGTYKIDIIGRGEEMLYSDGDIELTLVRTYCDGHRIFCNSTLGIHGGLVLPVKKRRQIIENLCDYFDTKIKALIFVLDEADKDRQALERLFEDLISQGHKLSVEYDSAAQREKAKDDMFISILKAGKKLSIHGVEISSVEDYWKWKHDA